MKILVDKQKASIILENDAGNSLSFSTSDVSSLQAIDAYLEREKANSLDFKLITIVSGNHLLQFSTGYQINVSSALAFDIANRMILLNRTLQYPAVHNEADASESEIEN